MPAPDLDTTSYACPACIGHNMADECWHSEAYWPIAVALAQAVHGPESTEEQQSWFVDDAEAIGSDVVKQLEPPYTAKQLGAVDTNLMPYLLNGRMVVALQGSDDGSGEVFGYAVALLDPLYEDD